MNYTFKGTLKVKNDEQVISDKFRKREFVITSEDEKYPQDVSFQLTQDRVDLIDKSEVGSVIIVHFNLRGREWVNPKDGVVKYFNTLDAWRIESGTAPDAKVAETNSFEEQEDDLPF